MIYGLPDKLKMLRKQNDYSQRQIADIIDVSPSIISGYETGERTPSVEKLIALANLYHVSTDYLLGIDRVYGESALNTSRLTERQLFALRNLIDTIN